VNIYLLAKTWQKEGKIGLHAFKSRCLNKFKICDLSFPRDLGEEFLKLIVPAPKDVALGPFNGTCLMMTYSWVNDDVTDLVLREVSCVGKNAPYLCEVF
jgi:hypothetical protein